MSLDDTFLLDGGEDLPISDIPAVKLDQINTLDTVARLALEAYKSQMEDIAMLDVENRAKHMEVANRYLDSAKDAMYKKEQILLQYKKITPPKPEEAPEETKGSITRDELYERRRKKLAEQA